MCDAKCFSWFSVCLCKAIIAVLIHNMCKFQVISSSSRLSMWRSCDQVPECCYDLKEMQCELIQSSIKPRKNMKTYVNRPLVSCPIWQNTTNTWAHYVYWLQMNPVIQWHFGHVVRSQRSSKQTEEIIVFWNRRYLCMSTKPQKHTSNWWPGMGIKAISTFDAFSVSSSRLQNAWVIPSLQHVVRVVVEVWTHNVGVAFLREWMLKQHSASRALTLSHMLEANSEAVVFITKAACCESHELLRLFHHSAWHHVILIIALRSQSLKATCALTTTLTCFWQFQTF